MGWNFITTEDTKHTNSLQGYYKQKIIKDAGECCKFAYRNVGYSHLIDDDEEMEPININNEDMLDPMHDSSEDECFEYGANGLANGDCQLDD